MGPSYSKEEAEKLLSYYKEVVMGLPFGKYSRGAVVKQVWVDGYDNQWKVYASSQARNRKNFKEIWEIAEHNNLMRPKEVLDTLH